MTLNNEGIEKLASFFALLASFDFEDNRTLTE